MSNTNHYDVLEVAQRATQKEIKQAYRRLVKQFHPDAQSEEASHERIISINAAYEILGDAKRRHSYDRELSNPSATYQSNRQERTAAAQKYYQSNRQKQQEEQTHEKQWIRQVYTPVNRLINAIISPLNREIDYLSADPFDDELMESFQDYLEDCQTYFNKAKKIFVSQPNPTTLASVALNIYYCLNHLHDGIEELQRFTMNYDEHYLHAGKELFRMSQKLRREAQQGTKIV
jgi:molecular chaperone DnaJ